MVAPPKLTQPRARNFERTNHYQTNLELQPRRASWLGVQRLVRAMEITLEALISGVNRLENETFPLESMPPQGSVDVVFKNGEKVNVPANEDEFKEALYAMRALRANADLSDRES